MGNIQTQEIESLAKEIKSNAEIIARFLKQGKHIELCESKNGLRMIAMDRRIVK